MTIRRGGYGDGGAIACCVVSDTSSLVSRIVLCFYQDISI